MKRPCCCKLHTGKEGDISELGVGERQFERLTHGKKDGYAK